MGNGRLVAPIRSCVFAAMAILTGALTGAGTPLSADEVVYSTAASTDGAEPPSIIGADGDAASGIQGAGIAANASPSAFSTKGTNFAGGAIPFPGSAGFAGFGASNGGGGISPATAVGRALSASVIQMGRAVSAEIHRTGGYRFDGYNDCYGFVRRTWNPILRQLHLSRLPGNYPTVLPVGDYRSNNWYPIRSWDALVPGDVLGTVQGHRYGGDVDYGMYGGKKGRVQYTFANGGGAGPVFAPADTAGGWYRYYYGPTHALLTQ